MASRLPPCSPARTMAQARGGKRSVCSMASAGERPRSIARKARNMACRCFGRSTSPMRRRHAVTKGIPAFVTNASWWKRKANVAVFR